MPLDIYKLTQIRKIASPNDAGSDGQHIYDAMTDRLETMGNPRGDLAFGGCAIALSLAAAYSSLPASTSTTPFAIYSVLGNFLGPTEAAKPVRLFVRSLRDTRSFATRLVLVAQQQPNGEWRPSFSALCDFVAAQDRESPSTLMSFSAKPQRKYEDPDKLPTREAWLQEVRKKGTFSDAELAIFSSVFGTMPRYVDLRAPPDGMAAQKLWGIDTKAKTTQDHLEFTERYNSDYFRSIIDLQQAAQQKHDGENLSLAALNACLAAFYTDGMIAFLPLTLSRNPSLWFADTAACSSLEFALRFHTDQLDLSQWHLREMQTASGGHARTYSESRVFDKSGRLVVTMSQQAVLRANPTSKYAGANYKL